MSVPDPALPCSASRLRARGAAALADAGIDSAASEAGWLLAHVLGTDPGRLLLIDDVDSVQRAAYDRVIARRAQRVPLQHLIGHTNFAGVDLAVGPGVFVPRPETEWLVEWAQRACADQPGELLPVVDLCAGSGALALAIATAVPRSCVTAVERAPRALDYLRRNVAAQPDAVARRVRVHAGDVTDPAGWEALADSRVIVANPPYVPSGAAVSPEARTDPADAVFSGVTGMDVIAAMVPLIAGALAPGGMVAVEHDDTTSALTTECFAADGRFTDIVGHTDLTGRPRFVTAVRSGGGEPNIGRVQGWTS